MARSISGRSPPGSMTTARLLVSHQRTVQFCWNGVTGTMMALSLVTARHPGGVSCSAGLRGFGNESVLHLAQALDLGLHDVAGLEERVGALPDAAAGAAAENIARLERENARGVFDLLFGRKDELRGIAVLLHLAVDGEADEQVHMVRHEDPRHEKRSHRSEIVVDLYAEPIQAEGRPVGAELQL